MERCLLVALMVYPFVVLVISAWPVLPGTMTVFLAAVFGYGVWLAAQRLRERNGESQSHRA
jgi:hypothetical protein